MSVLVWFWCHCILQNWRSKAGYRIGSVIFSLSPLDKALFAATENVEGISNFKCQLDVVSDDCWGKKILIYTSYNQNAKKDLYIHWTNRFQCTCNPGVLQILVGVLPGVPYNYNNIKTQKTPFHMNTTLLQIWPNSQRTKKK